MACIEHSLCLEKNGATDAEPPARSESLALPAAGYRNDSTRNNAGSNGTYWSSSLNADDPSYAWGVGFYSGDVGRYDYDRYYGFSVRPVCQ